jgi:hypothetical protein
VCSTGSGDLWPPRSETCAETRPAAARLWEAMGISVGIAAVGNGVVIVGWITRRPEWATLIGNPAVAMAAVMWMRRRGSPPDALGLPAPGSPRVWLEIILLGELASVSGSERVGGGT